MTAPEEAELWFAIFGSPAVAKWSVTGEVQTHNKGVHEMMAASFICLSLVYSFCSGSHTYLCMHRGSAGSWEVPHSPPQPALSRSPPPPALFRRPVHCNYVQFHISLLSLSSREIISSVLVRLSGNGGSKEPHLWLSHCVLCNSQSNWTSTDTGGRAMALKPQVKPHGEG